jgi:hypothetical protein
MPRPSTNKSKSPTPRKDWLAICDTGRKGKELAREHVVVRRCLGLHLGTICTILTLKFLAHIISRTVGEAPEASSHSA